MNKKTKYNDEFKKKVILETLRNEKTIVEISSEYQVHKASIRDWKKKFIENMGLSINPEEGVKKYREEIEELKKETEEAYKQIGKLTTQLD